MTDSTASYTTNPTAPLSGVEEVDATILFYLSLERLQTLTFDRQRPRSQPSGLLADDSRVWASLLGRALGVDLIHGRGVPYRTLYLAAIMKVKYVYKNPERGSDANPEVWLASLDYTIESVKAAIERSGGNMRSPGREALGLLVAVLDHIAIDHTFHLDAATIGGAMEEVYLSIMDTMAKVGCMVGWEVMASRVLDLTLPVDFPMTQYDGHDKDTILRLASATLIGGQHLWLTLCHLMRHHTITVDDMERLVKVYLWHHIASRDDNGGPHRGDVV